MPDIIKMNRQLRKEEEKKSRLLPLLISLFMIMVLSGLFVLWHIQKMSLPGNISDELSFIEVRNQEAPLIGYAEALKQQPLNHNSTINIGTRHSVQMVWIPMTVLKSHMEKGSHVLYVDHPNFLAWDAYWYREGDLREATFSKQFVLPFIDLEGKIEKADDEGLLIRVEPAVSAYALRQVDDAAYYQLQNWLLIYMLFVIGIIFAAFILDAALALILKENAFIFHALFLASALLYMYTSSGLSRISLGDFGYHFFVFGFTTIISAVWFIDWYLYYKVRLGVYHRLALVLYLIGLLGIVFSLFYSGNPTEILYVYRLLIVYGLLASIWAVLSLVVFVRRFESFSVFFVIGSIFQAITIPLLVVGTITDTNYGIILKLLYMLAAAVNAVFYTLGLIHESRIFKEDSEYYFKMAITDPLTGAYNRYFIDTQLNYRRENGLLNEEESCYLLIDIDHFKGINDQYGHDVGDQVLITLVNLLKNATRREDLLSRWGGEEFTILLNRTSLSDGLRLAEKLRQTVAEHHFEVVGKVTVSIGVTTYKGNESLEAWFVRADQLLYEAKQSGRNCIKGA